MVHLEHHELLREMIEIDAQLETQDFSAYATSLSQLKFCHFVSPPTWTQRW